MKRRMIYQNDLFFETAEYEIKIMQIYIDF